MYEAYWNVESNPFECGLDTRFFFMSQAHEASLLKLRYLVEDNKGAGLLVGGSGTGKTLVTHRLVEELSESCGPVVRLGYPRLSATELLAWFAVELGTNEAEADSKKVGLDRLLRLILGKLKQHTKENRHPLFIIDEAHLIDDPAVFQTLHLLLNFQSQPEIHLTLLLVGERSLLNRVARIPALEERIAVKSLLRPLSLEETADYVSFRLNVAGVQSQLFDDAALESLFELSGGVPRKINRICDLAMLVGYADGLSEFSADEIETVSQELTAVIPD